VDQGSAGPLSTTYCYDCSYLADSVALQTQESHRSLFSGHDGRRRAREDPLLGDKRKLGGLRLYTAGGTHDKQSTWMSDPKTFPGWECARELGLAVCVSLAFRRSASLLVLIKQFPQVRIIIDHMIERPSRRSALRRSEFVFRLARYGNVFLK